MDAGRECDRLRCEFQHYLLESFCRVWDPNLRGGNLLGKIRRHKNGRGARLAELRDIFWVAEKGNFAVDCLSQGCGAGDFLCRVADQLATGDRREFLKCEGHFAKIASAE